jgi:hypothetical protein
MASMSLTGLLCRLSAEIAARENGSEDRKALLRRLGLLMVPDRRGVACPNDS